MDHTDFILFTFIENSIGLKKINDDSTMIQFCVIACRRPGWGQS